MKKASDTFTHIDNKDDVVYLRTKAFPVNMRLFHSNKGYNLLIRECCDLVRQAALESYEDYKQPHGMSGANLAIPFNIIGIVRKRGKKDANVEIMINPVVLGQSDILATAKSNCGSIRLKKPIDVTRPLWVRVGYFSERGTYIREVIDKQEGAFTIQHEIDHNNGILITDRIKK